MKWNNNIIRITNKETGEVRYFLKDEYVRIWLGISQAGLTGLKSGKSRKYEHISYDIVDGGEIKYKDINNVR